MPIGGLNLGKGALWKVDPLVSVTPSGAAVLKASLNITNADTWFDSPEGAGDMNTVLQHATADFTMEGWIRVPSLPGGEQKVVATVDDVTSCFVSVQSTNINFRAGANAVQLAIVEDTWTHFAMTFDASSGQLSAKVGGTGDFTDDASPATISNPTNYVGFRLGDWGAGNGTPCKYAEIRVWSDIRTAAEIAANYNRCISSAEPGLVALYASSAAATGAIATVDDEVDGDDDLTRQNGTNAAWDTGDLPF